MTFYAELDNLTLDELIERFRGPPIDGEEYGAIFYEEVTILIREHGDGGLAFLLGECERVGDDEDRLRGVLVALSWPPPDPQIRAFLRPYLRNERPLVVMEAVEGLRWQQDSGARDPILALRNHASPYVQGSVLRYLQNLYPEEAVPLALAALHAPHYVVRESAIDVLDELGAVEALAAIRPFLADSHPDVRQAAETAVQDLEELQTEGRADPAIE